jgi:hypothetical protein
MSIGSTSYKVGVALALTSNHAEILGALGKHLLGVNVKIKDLEENFGRVGKALGGAFAMVTGGVILHGLESIVRKTQDLSQEMARLQMLGVSAQETARIRERAGSIAARTPGTTSKDVMEAYGQTYSMLGAGEAEKLMEPLTRFRSAMTAISGKAVNAEQLREVTRAADLLGRLNDPKTGNYDPARFGHFLDLAAKTYSATHGAVGPQQWLMLGQQGGPALMGQNDRGLATAAIMAQMMGGYRAGTAEMSLYQQFVGGTMSRRSAEELVQLGILSSSDIAERGRSLGGHHLRLGHGPRGSTVGRSVGGSEGGAMNLLTPEGQKKLSDFLGDSPLEAAGRMRQQLEQQGINDPQEQLKHIFKAFGRMTTQRLMADIMRSFTQISGELGRLDSSADVDRILKIAHDTSVPYNIRELNAAWQELLYTIGDSLNPIAIETLHALTDSVKGLGAVAKGINPAVLKALAIGIGAIGGALVGVGAAAIVAALGAGGWLVVAIGAAVGGLTALVAVNWTALTGYIASFRQGIEDLMHVLGGVVDKVKSWFSGSVPKGDGSALGFPGSNPFFIPQAFHPAGNAALGGLHSGGGYTLLPGGGGVAPHAMGRHPAMPSPGTNLNFLTDGAGSGLGGSAFLKARRSKFGREISTTPGLRDEILGMMLKEGTPQHSAESLFNRSDYSGKSLHQMLHSGFYGPIRNGALPGAIARLHRDPALYGRLNRQLEAVLGGSHLIGGRTDQGMPSDPNGMWPGGRIYVPDGRGGGNVFNDWGGGPGGHAGARAYREMIEQGLAASLHGKALRDHFGFRGRHNPEHPSAAIPPQQRSEADRPIVMTLDGDVVARHSLKRMVSAGNMAPKGTRMPDFSRARPNPV